MRWEGNLVPDLWIITGRQNSGKTSMILDIVKEVQAKGYLICGLVSPGIYEKNEKIAIQVVNLETEQKKILADRKLDPNNLYPLKKWEMHDEIIQWGEKQLQEINPKGKIFFLDEIGIYEIMEQRGWQTGIKIITQKTYQKAFLSVRREMLSAIVKLCEKFHILYEILDIDTMGEPYQEKIPEIINKL